MRKIRNTAAAVTVGIALAAATIAPAHAGRVITPQNDGRVHTVAASTGPQASPWSNCGVSFGTWVLQGFRCGRLV